MPLDVKLLDDSTRPEIPKLEGVTEAQRGPGRHLAEVHESFRDNMRILRRLIEAAASGAADPAGVKAEAAALPLLANYRRFGNLCGQHCQIIALHHSIEDQALFPALSEKSAALKRIVDRLRAEHEIVHDLLERLAAGLALLAGETARARFDEVVATYEVLERVLNSHFGYEEAGIGDALGYYGVMD